MNLPLVRGLIDRRILINYRADPGVLARWLPVPFRPKLIRGYGIAGICLIRLKGMRPWFVPGALGSSSENAAHRVAVQWDHKGRRCEGVYIPRRDTSSRLNALVGGRLFPGTHHVAKFDVRETLDHFHVEMNSLDGEVHVLIDASLAPEISKHSVFNSVQQASDFFQRGSLGYSPTRREGKYDGLELACRNWRMDPLMVERVESSLFDNRELFPPGSLEFDSAFLMRGIEHVWKSREALECCAEKAVAPIPEPGLISSSAS